MNYLLSSKLNEQPFKRIPASSMLVLPSTSFMALASSFAARDSGTTGTIATTAAAAGDFAAAATDMPVHSSILSALESAPTTLSSIRSCLDTRVTPQDLPASSDTLDDAWVFFSAPVARLFELLAAAQNHAFEPLFGHPWVMLSTTALVTVSDMVPFVPCQPLAISLGARYGVEAVPVCVVGQTLAGVLAFQSSRTVAEVVQVPQLLASLGDAGRLRFQKFQIQSRLGEGDDETGGGGAAEPERTVLFALVGLRLAPFFPFSAGNYLLGGATEVGLRPFVVATLLGCTVSNAISILLGMGGAELLTTTAST